MLYEVITIPPERVRYLAEISDTLRAYHEYTDRQAIELRQLWHYTEAIRMLKLKDSGSVDNLIKTLQAEAEKLEQALDPETIRITSYNVCYTKLLRCFISTSTRAISATAFQSSRRASIHPAHALPST